MDKDKGKILADKDELNTRAKILRAAKQEFFTNGFADTNVRAIAEKAGVTTGALYNLFDNKDGIFEALVSGVFDEFLDIVAHRDVFDAENFGMKTSDLSAIIELSQRRFLKMMDFFYDNWDAMKLIVCCSKGSSYEHIFDKAIDITEKDTFQLLKLDGVKMSRRIRFFIHVMVTVSFENLKEIFYHNLKKTEAVKYVLDFNVYHCAGWKQYWMEQVKG
ncbi:TetR/AcrR family transcriptional regulator [Treponema denticola]|uniref:TetR/AcrR family transcriptional regulator n=2 Tax=Treponema denticola TaxID=158 RepID=A0A9Q9BPJ9_TREDN|nr:TetR/AcrR family transcriptional regulator [Treponema denticola]UTC96683.1 TetR/AcrR family transcriptional regulator [Treponema denticola]UTD01514.1 TetR/AcrR family transcriptional regulator [Treponema denticola]